MRAKIRAILTLPLIQLIIIRSPSASDGEKRRVVVARCCSSDGKDAAPSITERQQHLFNVYESENVASRARE